MRQRFEDLPLEEQVAWIASRAKQLTDAGHSFADTCPADHKKRALRQEGKWAWERAHRTRLERWSNGWYGMKWKDHKSMFVNNYIGHRNSQTYVNGPKFYIPPRRGPWLRFLRWLQVIPPRPITVKDAADIISQKPFT
jgi:hypothetical protein